MIFLYLIKFKFFIIPIWKTLSKLVCYIWYIYCTLDVQRWMFIVGRKGLKNFPKQSGFSRHKRAFFFPRFFSAFVYIQPSVAGGEIQRSPTWRKALENQLGENSRCSIKGILVIFQRKQCSQREENYSSSRVIKDNVFLRDRHRRKSMRHATNKLIYITQYHGITDCQSNWTNVIFVTVTTFFNFYYELLRKIYNDGKYLHKFILWAGTIQSYLDFYNNNNVFKISTTK